VVVVEAMAAAVVEALLLRREVVAVVEASAVAVDQVRALVPNAARAELVWEITARPETDTTARLL
jgi:hypothetical protein